MSTAILEQLQQHLPHLSRSERKVAEIILEDPQHCIRASIATLAKQAEVSEPTVNRFCRSLGCSGFPDFKLQLAQSLVKGTPFVSRDVEMGDNCSQYCQKIFQASINSLTDAMQSLDHQAISNCVEHLHRARSISFFGLGASGPVAMDALHKFFRLNIPVQAWTDVMNQRMAAAAAQPNDVHLFISNTGRTTALVEAAEISKNSGATVITITHADTPLAQQAHHLIDVSCSEDTEIYTPMVSRLVHLTILDTLATGVLLAKGPSFQSHLKRLKSSLAGTRLEASEVLAKKH